VPHNDWYDAHGSWDGSLAIPNEWNGLTEPVVVMTAVPGRKPPGVAEGARPPPDTLSTLQHQPDNPLRALHSGLNGAGAGAGAGVPGIDGGSRSRMSMEMVVVHATNASDPFLLSWTKDANNPINFSSGMIGSPYQTPSQVWKNGDHWNMLICGTRYVFVIALC
jgi:hypothetical protein